jgi:hypothetical protein
MKALDQVREVYGVHRIWFDKNARAIQVEYDASRLRADDIAALLREAGGALRERPPPQPMMPRDRDRRGDTQESRRSNDDREKLMGEESQSSAQRRATRSRKQSERLQQEQTKVAKLVDAKNKKDFFKQLLPLWKPLRSYIERRLRLAYLSAQIRTPIYTSGDFLDEVVLQAYEHYDKKPENLSLDE